MSRFEVTIKDIDLDTDVILEAARVSDGDMQKVLFSSNDGIHVSSQGNIGAIIFDDDAEYFPTFGCHPQESDHIGHSYEITIKADEFDRWLVINTTKMIFLENLKKYTKQQSDIPLTSNRDNNEVSFYIDGSLGVEPVMLIIPTTPTTQHHNYITYEIVED